MHCIMMGVHEMKLCIVSHHDDAVCALCVCVCIQVYRAQDAEEELG